MGDYISRETAINDAKNLVDTMSVCVSMDECNGMRSMKERAMSALERIQAADVRPVVRGEWIETGYFDQYYQPIYECSHCHREVADSFMAKHLFCLHCGADMRPDGGADNG